MSYKTFAFTESIPEHACVCMVSPTLCLSLTYTHQTHKHTRAYLGIFLILIIFWCTQTQVGFTPKQIIKKI